MERLEFNDIKDLADLLYELATKEKSVITTVLFYDNTQYLLKALLEYKDINIGHINFESQDYGYKDEYYITLDTNLVLDIEPVKKDSDYVCIDTDAILFDGDANSKIAIINTNCLQFELVLNKIEPVKIIDNDKSCGFNDLIHYIYEIMNI